MRDDMDRVLVTRPRLGGKVRRKGRMRRMDDPPARVGMKRSLAFTKEEPKDLNEHLQPLRRYLHAQAGRPWNKVWSDICATLRPSSAVQQHVRDHVFDFVAKDVSLGGRDLWVCQYGRARLLRESDYELWVDPRTGILRHNRHRVTWRRSLRERRAEAGRDLRARMVPGKGDVQYHLLADGAWWEVTLAHHAEVPPPDGARPMDAVLDARLSALPPRELYGREGVRAVGKRQLSRREAARLGLRSSRAVNERVGGAV